jgi:hypothetical protein
MALCGRLQNDAACCRAGDLMADHGDSFNFQRSVFDEVQKATCSISGLVSVSLVMLDDFAGYQGTFLLASFYSLPSSYLYLK